MFNNKVHTFRLNNELECFDRPQKNTNFLEMNMYVFNAIFTMRQESRLYSTDHSIKIIRLKEVTH